jgi:hypothetical protein
MQGRGFNVAVGVGVEGAVRAAVFHKDGLSGALQRHIELDFDAEQARELSRLLSAAADALD